MTTPRLSTPDAHEPHVHELPPVRGVPAWVETRLVLRRDDGGAWRGRLRFTDTHSDRTAETAEIFCGRTEAELWQSVQALREHHVRDLYRSLS